MADTPAAPGWYPAGEYGKLRWWDGTRWTEHRAVAPAWLTKQEYRYRQQLLGQAWTFRSKRSTVAAMVACLVVPLPLLVMGFTWLLQPDVTLGFEAIAGGVLALLAPFWLMDAVAAIKRGHATVGVDEAAGEYRVVPRSEHGPVVFPPEVAFLRGRLSPQLGLTLGIGFLAGAATGVWLIFAWHGWLSVATFGLLILGGLGWVAGLTLAMGAAYRSLASRD